MSPTTVHGVRPLGPPMLPAVVGPEEIVDTSTRPAVSVSPPGEACGRRRVVVAATVHEETSTPTPASTPVQQLPPQMPQRGAADAPALATPRTGETPHPTRVAVGELHRVKADNHRLADENQQLTRANRRLEEQLERLVLQTADAAAATDTLRNDLTAAQTRVADATTQALKEQTRAVEAERDLESYKALHSAAMKRCERLEADKAALKASAAEAQEQHAKVGAALQSLREEMVIRAEEGGELERKALALAAENTILQQRVEAYESRQLEVEMLRRRVQQLTANAGGERQAVPAAPLSRCGSSASNGRPRSAPRSRSGSATAKGDAARAAGPRERIGFLMSSSRGLCGGTTGLHSPRVSRSDTSSGTHPAPSTPRARARRAHSGTPVRSATRSTSAGRHVAATAAAVSAPSTPRGRMQVPHLLPRNSLFQSGAGAGAARLG